MANRKVAVAFAGAGPSSYENTRDLLNDYFGFGQPDKEGFFDAPDDLDLHILLPASENHITESLMTVFDWTDFGEQTYDLYVEKGTSDKGKNIRALLKYADKMGQVANVNAALIDGLKTAEENGYEPLLLLFWGDEGDENSEILLDLATSAGIKAKDVSAGLDDISFEDEGAPEPEPEPEPEEKPRRRGRSRQSLEEESKPLEDKDDEPEEKPEPKRRGRARQPEPVAEEPESPVEEAVREAKAKEEPDLQQQINAAAHQTATRQDTDDVITKSLQLKHDAKRREVSADIRNRCGYHKATDDTAPLHAAIRKVTEDFMHILDGLLPSGREKSLALTNAEQAMFWANAAVARSGGQEPTVEGSSEPVDEDTDEPKRGRGRPRKDGQPTRTRSAEEKALTEIWDEDEREWKPKGRGRIPKGAKTRLVDPKTREVISESE